MLTDGSSAGSQILLDSDLDENLYKALHVLPTKNTLDCGDAILFTLPSPYASKDHLLFFQFLLHMGLSSVCSFSFQVHFSCSFKPFDTVK